MKQEQAAAYRFAACLRIVAVELQAMAAQLERLGTTDQLGELGCSTYAIEAQAAVYDLLKLDKEI